MSEPLAEAARLRLLQHARAVLGAVAQGSALPPPPADDALQELSVVFVTLRCDGELRGCVGNPHEQHPLGAAVGLMTRQAALDDPRFPPMTADEAARATIEISRLFPPRHATPEEIELGTHGVWVSQGGRQGLLLPQVAREHALDLEGFLELVCHKAGLPGVAWREEGVTLTIFEAEVFGE